MRKIGERDEKAIVAMLRKWKRSPLRWELVRERISAELLDGEKSWSRKSLQANESINAAWGIANGRLTGSGRCARVHESDEPSEIERLQAELVELNIKYDKLLIRHRQVIHNAALLPGGTRLLLDPLPDNTPVQKEGGMVSKLHRHN